MGSTSPKTTRRMVMAPMATARPAGPKSVAAMEAARAEAPMLARVMPTRMVTRRSWGRVRSGWTGPRSGSCCSARRRSRARPSEKYAASAPVRRAEAITSTIRLISSRAVSLGTKMLVAGLHAHRTARAVEEGHARLQRFDLPDHGQRGARGAMQAGAERLHGMGIAGEEELEVFAARGRPREGIRAERLRHLARRRIQGQAIERDARSHPTRPADVGEISGEAIGAIHHGVDAARGVQPSTLGHAGGGPEMGGGN